MKHSGIVHSFDETGGHGFIKPDDGGCDLGFESSDLSLVGIDSPKVGSRLTYHLSGKNRHASAVDVRRTLSAADRSGCKPFSVFRSAREEAAIKAARDKWANGGGHMNSTSGLVVSTPGAELPYKVLLRHAGLPDTEHPFRTIRQCEAFIRRNTPRPLTRKN